MKIHPLADRFPMMPKEDLQELGLNEPIVTDETGELVLDGRNRLAACKLAGVKPIFKKLEAGRDHDAYILSANVWRRMLTKGQQAMAIAMAYPELEKGGRGKKSEAKNWAATAQFSTRRVKLAQQVLRHSSSYADAVLAGTITLSDHILALLPHDFLPTRRWLARSQYPLVDTLGEVHQDRVCEGKPLICFSPLMLQLSVHLRDLSFVYTSSIKGVGIN